eukprot:4808490-Karenia_brevis.AAC.1
MFKTGDTYIEQVDGVPVGGPLSSALLDTYMSCAESLYDKDGWQHEMADHDRGLPRKAVFAGCRYDDDIL